MQRITITLDDDLMEELDRVIAAKGYQNRSEAIRDLAQGRDEADINRNRCSNAGDRCSELCLRSWGTRSCTPVDQYLP